METEHLFLNARNKTVRLKPGKPYKAKLLSVTHYPYPAFVGGEKLVFKYRVEQRDVDNDN